MMRAFAALFVASTVLTSGLIAQEPGPVATASEISTAIDHLGSFDDATRVDAARLLRRVPQATAVEVLSRAVRTHKDEYVRYKALVLLAGLGDAAADPLMREVMTDRNDRLRTVAFGWFEHHPDPDILPALIEKLGDERSEFVRPALTRAIAAQPSDPRARAALVPLVMRGEDLFRGAVIEALGDYGAKYALPDITEVARLDGPLQDDAITALGKLGDASTAAVLAELRGSVREELQPTVSAALCLIDVGCDQQMAYLQKTLLAAAADARYQPLLRADARALAVLAIAGREGALASIIDAGVSAENPARAPIALAVGFVALRRPLLMLDTLETRADPAPLARLLRDAFDMLSGEDFEQERFYVAVRRAYWTAPDGSARRAAARTLIETLEF